MLCSSDIIVAYSDNCEGQLSYTKGDISDMETLAKCDLCYSGKHSAGFSSQLFVKESRYTKIIS